LYITLRRRVYDLNKRDASPRDLTTVVSLRPSVPIKIPMLVPQDGTRLIKVRVRIQGASVPLIKSHRSAPRYIRSSMRFPSQANRAKLFTKLFNTSFALHESEIARSCLRACGWNDRHALARIPEYPRNFVRDPTSTSSPTCAVG